VLWAALYRPADLDMSTVWEHANVTGKSWSSEQSKTDFSCLSGVGTANRVHHLAALARRRSLCSISLCLCGWKNSGTIGNVEARSNSGSQGTCF
jgi:hypothetical protein